jgi:5-formyltetrahydrofolate cyclo-ligase
MAAPRSPLPNEALDEAKRRARAAALERRLGCDPALGAALARHVLASGIALPPIVSGFWPLAQEIDIRPLLHALHQRGHRIALPATPKRGNPLIFHEWQPGAAMLPEPFGTSRPDGPVLVPDLLFVPLLAFDRHGHRLGYGGGYYDRTLATLPGRPAIGCAFAAQEIDAVPAGPHDIRLAAIATEHGLMRCEH